MQYMVRMSLRSACTCMGTCRVCLCGGHGLNFLTTLSNTTCKILFGFNSSTTDVALFRRLSSASTKTKCASLSLNFKIRYSYSFMIPMATMSFNDASKS